MKDKLDLRTFYIAEISIHAHNLIAMGYEQMEYAQFVRSEEPDITGELVRVMKVVLESFDAPDWAKFYFIADDPPLNVDGRRGKSRPRVDIEFERTGVHSPRPRLRFEAKRLSTPGHTIAAYLGPDGMGCFISGKYPTALNEAGMIGYVQTGSEKEWSDKIEKALAEDRGKYSVASPPYKRQQICALEHTYVSQHNGTPHSDPITIHHIFLRYY